MAHKSTESIDSIFELHDELPPERSGRWGRVFPYGFWYEWKNLAVLAIPIMLTGLVEYMIAPVSLFFCGRLGKTELAAAGLAISIFHVAGVSVIMGLLTASETLFAQTVGGTNKFRLGVQVQRASVILISFCLPCWSIYLIIEPILLASNQPPLICKYVGEYLLGLVPALFFITVFEIGTKYVQAQNKVLPSLVAGVLGNLVNAGAHYLFIAYTDMGFIGSALSQSLGYMTQAVSVIAYILISRIYRKTWDAVHVELWHDWGTWFRLAIPGVMMSGMEWWVCESGSLVSGLRGEKALAVQTIVNNIESVIYSMFPLGFGIATTIRIGQFLGANKPTGPHSTVCVALITILVVTVVNSIIMLSSRFHIPKIFTSDPGIIEMTGHSLISLTVFSFFDSIVGVCSGIIRGAGMQRTGAIVCAVCMYGIGGPVGLCLLLLTELSVSGFWWGLSVGMGIESLVYVILILRIDWIKMCAKAEKRTAIKFINGDIEGKCNDVQGDDVGVKFPNASTDTNLDETEKPKACTPTVIATRSLLLGSFVIMLISALCCRFFLNWKDHFMKFCLLSNGSILPLEVMINLQMDSSCLRTLP